MDPTVSSNSSARYLVLYLSPSASYFSRASVRSQSPRPALRPPPTHLAHPPAQPSTDSSSRGPAPAVTPRTRRPAIPHAHRPAASRPDPVSLRRLVVHTALIDGGESVRGSLDRSYVVHWGGIRQEEMTGSCTGQGGRP